MAKKKKAASSGSSVGLILTLIFFVLTTFIAGSLAYFAYEEIEGHKAEAAKAKKAQALADAQFKEERVRKVMLRVAIGVDDPADRQLLVAELDPQRVAVKEEYDRMKIGLEGKIPEELDPKDNKKKSAFYWPLLAMNAQQLQDVTVDVDGTTKDPAAIAADPATKPFKTIPEMIGIYSARADAADARERNTVAKVDDLEKRVSATQVNKDKIEKDFNDALDRIRKETDAKHVKLDGDFQALARKHLNDAKAALDRVRDLGTADNAKADQIAALNGKMTQLNDLLDKLQNQAASSSRSAIGVDFVNLEEKKGEIVRKEEGGYVVINIGSNKKIRPQVTFLVVSADISWLALIEKEESLKKSSYSNDRIPFQDNPYVKAGIEVVEVLGPDTSRAKVLFENEPIRNPIQIRDQIFNLAWEPSEEIRIAFAGIVDLDGDGLDNNDDFLRLLERQGVVVDEYLKLKPIEMVKRDKVGMSLRTKYLVIAPDPRLDAFPINAAAETPQVTQIKKAIEQMSEIKGRARELGVQVIEARKFLAMIGYRLPKNPLPPQYGASAYFEPSAPPPQMKKDGN